MESKDKTKICPICKVEKVIDEFYPRRRDGKTYLAYECKFCHRKRARDWQRKHPEKAMATHFMRRYGITLDDYNALLIKQKGMCAICGKLHKPKTITRAKKRVLNVDHDHKNNHVRGLICNACNSMLGYAKDEVRILESAIVYLKKHS